LIIMNIEFPGIDYKIKKVSNPVIPYSYQPVLLCVKPLRANIREIVLADGSGFK